MQGGSHREVNGHMPSAALLTFKVKAINLSFFASTSEGMIKKKTCRGDFPTRLNPSNFPGILSV